MSVIKIPQNIYTTKPVRQADQSINLKPVEQAAANASEVFRRLEATNQERKRANAQAEFDAEALAARTYAMESTDEFAAEGFRSHLRTKASEISKKYELDGASAKWFNNHASTTEASHGVMVDGHVRKLYVRKSLADLDNRFRSYAQQMNMATDKEDRLIIEQRAQMDLETQTELGVIDPRDAAKVMHDFKVGNEVNAIRILTMNSPEDAMLILADGRTKYIDEETRITLFKDAETRLRADADREYTSKERARKHRKRMLDEATLAAENQAWDLLRAGKFEEAIEVIEPYKGIMTSEKRNNIMTIAESPGGAIDDQEAIDELFAAAGTAAGERKATELLKSGRITRSTFNTWYPRMREMRGDNGLPTPYRSGSDTIKLFFGFDNSMMRFMSKDTIAKAALLDFTKQVEAKEQAGEVLLNSEASELASQVAMAHMKGSKIPVWIRSNYQEDYPGVNLPPMNDFGSLVTIGSEYLKDQKDELDVLASEARMSPTGLVEYRGNALTAEQLEQFSADLVPVISYVSMLEEDYGKR